MPVVGWTKSEKYRLPVWQTNTSLFHRVYNVQRKQDCARPRSRPPSTFLFASTLRGMEERRSGCVASHLVYQLLQTKTPRDMGNALQHHTLRLQRQPAIGN